MGLFDLIESGVCELTSPLGPAPLPVLPNVLLLPVNSWTLPLLNLLTLHGPGRSIMEKGGSILGDITVNRNAEALWSCSPEIPSKSLV